MRPVQAETNVSDIKLDMRIVEYPNRYETWARLLGTGVWLLLEIKFK